MAEIVLENNFYTRFMCDYAMESPEMREKSKRHWIDCYADKLAKGRFDDHSARILAGIALIDAGIAEAV